MVGISAIGPDGVTAPVSALDARWVTDTPSVLRVLPTGAITGLAAGRATVTATYRGVSGTLALRVVPDVAGAWTGFGHLTTCDGFSDFRTCSRSYPFDSVGQLSLSFVQEEDRVSADLTLDSTPPATAIYSLPSRYVAELAGTFLEDGTLALSGPAEQVLSDGVRIDVGAVVVWRAAFGDHPVTGTFALVVPSGSLPGLLGRVGWIIDVLHR